MSKLSHYVESAGAILLAIIWISPLLFAFWAAFHSTSDAVNFNITSAWTLDNFRTAWEGAPWLKYFLNTFLLVTIVLIGQFFFTTLAGFAFAKLEFPGKNFVSCGVKSNDLLTYSIICGADVVFILENKHTDLWAMLLDNGQTDLEQCLGIVNSN